MTLTSRLSSAFLGVLGLVLAGFSATLYLAAAFTLSRSVDDRLDATLATLTALVEDESGGLEWEPSDRRVIAGQGPGRDEVRWAVLDERGAILDRSPNLGEPAILAEPGPRRIDRRGRPWRVVARPMAPTSSPPGGEDPRFHPGLTLMAGARLDPIEATLRNLGLTLAGLSAGLWSLTALVGRRICRRALAPLTRMAGAARDLGADDPTHRLPVAPTGDELEDLAHAFNGLLGRRHEALERQRRFAGDASHQLRTPLTAVIGQVDVALRRDRPPEEYRRVLAAVRDQSDHLRRIVEALLFLARADAEAGELSPDEFDLIPWVGRQLDRRATLGGPDRPAWSPPVDGPYRVRAHPALLAQVLDNLLDNARDHGQPGEPATVRAWREPGSVVLAVEDRGPGIAPADRARVFEPFYRAAPTRKGGPAGVGLGLAVARRIARASRGSLDIEGEPGRGARFLLRLPEAPPRDPPPTTQPDDPASSDRDPRAIAPVGRADCDINRS